MAFIKVVESMDSNSHLRATMLLNIDFMLCEFSTLLVSAQTQFHTMDQLRWTTTDVNRGQF